MEDADGRLFISEGSLTTVRRKIKTIGEYEG
jgi:hypothetical protein